MIEDRTVKIAKEIDDVGLAIVEIIHDIKAKKPITEIAGENLQNLVAMVNGIDLVDDEYEANRRVAMATMGYRTGEMADALMPAPKPKV